MSQDLFLKEYQKFLVNYIKKLPDYSRFYLGITRLSNKTVFSIDCVYSEISVETFINELEKSIINNETIQFNGSNDFKAKELTWLLKNNISSEYKDKLNESFFKSYSSKDLLQKIKNLNKEQLLFVLPILKPFWSIAQFEKIEEKINEFNYSSNELDIIGNFFKELKYNPSDKYYIESNVKNLIKHHFPKEKWIDFTGKLYFFQEFGSVPKEVKEQITINKFNVLDIAIDKKSIIEKNILYSDESEYNNLIRLITRGLKHIINNIAKVRMEHDSSISLFYNGNLDENKIKDIILKSVDHLCNINDKKMITTEDELNAYIQYILLDNNIENKEKFNNKIKI